MARITDGYDWDNSLPKAFADLIEDREEDNAEAVIEWIHENESGHEMWDLIGGLADHIERVATREV